VLEHRQRNRILTAGFVVTLVLAVFGPLGSRVLPAPFDGTVAVAGCLAVLLAVFALYPERVKRLDKVLLMGASGILIGIGIGLALRDIQLWRSSFACLVLEAGHLYILLEDITVIKLSLEGKTEGFDVQNLPNDIASRYQVTSLEELDDKAAIMSEADRVATRTAFKQHFAEKAIKIERYEAIVRKVQRLLLLMGTVGVVGGTFLMFLINRINR
jgi:hypothetical protein